MKVGPVTNFQNKPCITESFPKPQCESFHNTSVLSNYLLPLQPTIILHIFFVFPETHSHKCAENGDVELGSSRGGQDRFSTATLESSNPRGCSNSQNENLRYRCQINQSIRRATKPTVIQLFQGQPWQVKGARAKIFLKCTRRSVKAHFRCRAAESIHQSEGRVFPKKCITFIYSSTIAAHHSHLIIIRLCFITAIKVCASIESIYKVFASP